MTKYVSTAPKKPKKSKVLIFLNIVIGILTAAVIIRLVIFLLIDSDRHGYYNRTFGDMSAVYSLHGERRCSESTAAERAHGQGGREGWDLRTGAGKDRRQAGFRQIDRKV